VWIRVEHWAYWRPQLMVVEKSVTPWQPTTTTTTCHGETGISPQFWVWSFLFAFIFDAGGKFVSKVVEFISVSSIISSVSEAVATPRVTRLRLCVCVCVCVCVCTTNVLLSWGQSETAWNVMGWFLRGHARCSKAERVFLPGRSFFLQNSTCCTLHPNYQLPDVVLMFHLCSTQYAVSRCGSHFCKL